MDISKKNPNKIALHFHHTATAKPIIWTGMTFGG